MNFFPPTIAAIDIGSNSLCLLLADLQKGLMLNRKVTIKNARLAEGLIEGQCFKDCALQRTKLMLAEFNEIIKTSKAEKVLAGGTMAVRLAKNGIDFMAELKDEYGWETKVLSAEQEANLAAKGMNYALKLQPEEALLIDIGGRSTELIFIKNNQVEATISLDMGVVLLTEMFLKNDPPLKIELEEMLDYIKLIFSKNLQKIFKGKPLLIGTAGTITSLAALILNLSHYNSKKINGALISLGEIKKLFHKIIQEPLQIRAKRPLLPLGRADIIIAGFLILLEVMDIYKSDKLIVSDYSLLEGLWLSAAGY